MSSLPEDRYPKIGEVTLYFCKECAVVHGNGKVCPLCNKPCTEVRVLK